jgi:hypothetical protein
VNEFWAELDWDRCGAIAMREDASTDALAGLEHDDVDTVLLEGLGGGKSSSASADDDDVRLVGGSIHFTK